MTKYGIIARFVTTPIVKTEIMTKPIKSCVSVNLQTLPYFAGPSDIYPEGEFPQYQACLNLSLLENFSSHSVLW